MHNIDVTQEVSERFQDCETYFRFVCESREKEWIRRAKGMLFVEAYAVYEYAVTAAIRHGLDSIATASLQVSDLRPSLMALALDDELKSVRDADRRKMWDSRIRLFQKLGQDCSEMNTEAFPGDGTHFRRKQLETIWLVFDLPGRIVPDRRLLPLIDEIVSHRNAIAHGRECPKAVGSKFSSADMRKKIRQTNRICKHVIEKVAARCANPTIS